MKTQTRRSKSLAVGLLLLASISIRAQVNVTTWHNDLARTGANTQETTLTTANVNVNNFGKLFSASVDGQVYAQPLYLSGVSIGGGTHNVLYIATEHDSVYAIDADSGTIYAQVSLIPPGGTTVNSSSDLNCGDINPEVGITGTPVIDPASQYSLCRFEGEGQRQRRTTTPRPEYCHACRGAQRPRGNSGRGGRYREGR